MLAPLSCSAYNPRMLKRIAVPIALLIALTVACSKQPAPADNTSAQPSNAPGGTSGSSATSSGSKKSEARKEGSKESSKETAAVKPQPVTLPAGTLLHVRLDQAVGSKISNEGDSFTATIEDPVVVDGTTVIPHGATASGVVSEAKPLGRFKGGAVLRLSLKSIDVNGAKYPVSASLSRTQQGKGKRSTIAIGGGAGLGALIGGIAGGGKGAAIGAAAGAGAGTAGAAFTGNKDIRLPAETPVTFELREATPLKKE